MDEIYIAGWPRSVKKNCQSKSADTVDLDIARERMVHLTQEAEPGFTYWFGDCHVSWDRLDAGVPDRLADSNAPQLLSYSP